MRCFISINLPNEIKERIKLIQDSLPEFIGKKTELENLHLTLKFLGEIDKEKIIEVKKKLLEIKFSPINLAITSLGFFSKEKIRIIWLKIEGCNELQKQIDFFLQDLFPKEERFMAHLTIARIKNIKNKKEFIEKLSQIKFSPINIRINSFSLMNSNLTSKGSDYTILQNYNLTS